MITSAMMLRAELCVQRNSTLYRRSAMAVYCVQQPPSTLTGAAPFASDGAQHDEVALSPLPQLPACSAPTGCALLLPYNGMAPSERKLSHAMPCGSVTQYLSDFA